MRKGKDLKPDPWIFELDPDPYLWLMDPGCPKTCGSGSGTGSGSPTLSHCQKQSPPPGDPLRARGGTIAKFWLLKQTSEMEEKQFMSSLKICPESAVGMGRDGVGGEPLSPLSTTLFSSWSVNVSFKDDVTVILLLGVSFTFGIFHQREWLIFST